MTIRAIIRDALDALRRRRSHALMLCSPVRLASSIEACQRAPWWPRYVAASVVRVGSGVYHPSIYGTGPREQARLSPERHEIRRRDGEHGSPA